MIPLALGAIAAAAAAVGGATYLGYADPTSYVDKLSEGFDALKQKVLGSSDAAAAVPAAAVAIPAGEAHPTDASAAPTPAAQGAAVPITTTVASGSGGGAASSASTAPAAAAAGAGSSAGARAVAVELALSGNSRFQLPTIGSQVDPSGFVNPVAASKRPQDVLLPPVLVAPTQERIGPAPVFFTSSQASGATALASSVVSGLAGLDMGSAVVAPPHAGVLAYPPVIRNPSFDIRGPPGGLDSEVVTDRPASVRILAAPIGKSVEQSRTEVMNLINSRHAASA